MSEDPPECFVCTESVPPPRKSACKCTDRYVHDACLARMLEARPAQPAQPVQGARPARPARPVCPVCPVCAAPYRNVASKMRVVDVTLWSAGGFVCGLLLAVIAMLGCAINTFVVIGNHRTLSHMSVAIGLGASVFIATLALGALGVIARGCANWGPRGLAESMIVRRRQVHVLPVAAPAAASSPL